MKFILTLMMLASLSAHAQTDMPCARGGCYGQECVEPGSKPIVLDCPVTAAATCTQYGECARVAGACGWKKSENYERCLNLAASGKLDKIPTDVTPSQPGDPTPKPKVDRARPEQVAK